jgi:hypothetical protein
VPLSPQILGRAAAALAEAGTLRFAAVEALLSGVEAVEPKRHFFRHLVSALAKELGQEAAAAMVKESGAHCGPLLDADAELDPGAPSVFDFMKSEGLEWVPL